MQIMAKAIVFWILALSIMGCKVEFPIVEWEDGIIPYYLTGDFTDQEIQYIRTAMDQWEQTCDVHFQEVTPRARAYNIIRIHATKWSSSIGENNSVCYMNFGDDYSPLGHITHELGHALGLLHEHQRPDRDQFITIHWDKIISIYLHNFEIRDNPLLVEESHDYDYQSIMHYPAKSFSIDQTETMVSISSDNPINRLDVITEKDAAKAREIYGPPEDE
jgi:hypothetical protein